MNEKREVPARFLLPQVTQGILDRTFTRMFDSLGISEDKLCSADPGVAEELDREVYSKGPSGMDVGPMLGAVDFKGNEFLASRALIGNALLKASGIRTSYELGDKPGTPWSALIQYPFKTIHLDQKLQEPASIGRWFVQLTPDSPPLMMHYDDIKFARKHSDDRNRIEAPHTARLVRETFGDEAVRVLDDRQSAEVIGLLSAAEPYVRVVDYSDRFNGYAYDT